MAMCPTFRRFRRGISLVSGICMLWLGFLPGCPDAGAASIEVTPVDLEFGAQPIGCPGDSLAFYIRNTGEIPAAFSILPIDGDDGFSFSGDDREGEHEIEVQEELLIHVSFAPGGEGAVSGAIHIDLEDPIDGDGSSTVTLSGSGVGDEDGDGLAEACGDCDDDCADCHPGADEVCDGLDSDCDGVVPTDEEDGDSDGWSTCEGDCDDLDETLHPGAEEGCDGIDTDCDGALGEAELDTDGDGFFAGCEGPSGPPDCDDANAEVFPVAVLLLDR